MKKSNIKKDAIVKRKSPLTLYKLKKEVNFIKKSIEMKNVSYDLTQTAVPQAGAITSVLTLPQGLTFTTRIGNRIQPLYLQAAFVVNYYTTTVQGCGSIDIVLDKYPTGSLPGVTSIFNGSHPKDLPLTSVVKRFKILKHVLFNYDIGTLSAKGFDFKAYIPLMKYGNTIYTGNAGDQTDFTSGRNDILIVYRSSNSDSPVYTYGCLADCKITFYDC